MAALMQSGAAMAAVDDLQIDWVIPADAIDENALNEGERRSVTIEPVPRKMFASGVEILATNGKKLVPAGAPLYAMVGTSFMVCSQAAAPDGFAAKGNRVCLRDTDGDGKLDSYFTRSRGRSFMAGDKMWFAMNSNIPKPVGTIQTVELAEVDRMQAPERPTMQIGFVSGTDGTVHMGIQIEGQHSFSVRCVEAQGVIAPDTHRAFGCMEPGFIVVRKAVGTPDEPAYALTVTVPKRELAVRFDVAPRLMGARLMSGMYFE